MITWKNVKFWEKRLSLHTFILVFSFWLALVCNTIFFSRLYDLTPYSGLSAKLFIIAMVVLLTAYYNFVLNLVVWRSTVKVVIFIFLFLSASASYFNYLGIGIDAFQIQNVLETDPKEISDLLSVNTLIWAILFFILPFIFFSLIKITEEKTYDNLKRKGFMLIASLLTISILFFVYYADLASIFRENRNLKGFISPQNVFASSWSYYKKLAPKQNIPFQAYGRDAVVLSNIKMRILIVDDNIDLVTNIFSFLETKDYILDAAYDAETAYQLCKINAYDLIILDWMLPKMQGIELLEKLRDHGVIIPIIMLTAKTELDDKLASFSFGVNDYLTKPFSLEELEARMIALHTLHVGQSKILQVADLKYDLYKDKITRSGQTIHLHASDKKVLTMLMRESPKIVLREQLESLLWGDDLPEKDLLRTHIYEIRKRIDTGFQNKLLKTIPKIGYQLILEQGLNCDQTSEP